MNYIKDTDVKLIKFEFSDNKRYLSFDLTNNSLLESNSVLKKIHNTLMSNKDFLKFRFKESNYC